MLKTNFHIPGSVLKKMSESSGFKCINCGKLPAGSFSIYIPVERGATDLCNAPEGGTKIIPYALCIKCESDPESIKKAEGIILGHFLKQQPLMNGKGKQ